MKVKNVMLSVILIILLLNNALGNPDTLLNNGSGGYTFNLSIDSIISALIGTGVTSLIIWYFLEKWAEKIFTQKASEKIGLDWNTVKQLAEERQKLNRVRGECSIAIVSKTVGKKDELHRLFKDNGFKEPKSFTISDFNKSFDINLFNIVLIDNIIDGDKVNSDGGIFTESEIKEQIIEPNKTALKFIWYTKMDVSTETFKIYKDIVSFVKKKNHLIENIDDFIL